MSQRVSVLIANYNGGTMLQECVESLFQQRSACELEIIVYDDASTDDSADRIKRRYPTINVIKGSRNLGFARANNLMARIATGEFLLLLNNDAYLGDGAIEALFDAAAVHPDRILSLRQVQARNGALIDLGMGLDFMLVPYPLEREGDAALISVIGACLWLPRRLFFELGQFPSIFGSIAEDLFLCLAARLRGVEVHVLPSHCYYHHGGISFGGSSSDLPPETTFRRRALSERNRLWITLTIFPGPLLAPTILLWLLAWILEAFVLCLAALSWKPATRIYARAVIDTIRSQRELRILRSRIQSTRKVRWSWFFAPFRLKSTKLTFLLKRGLPRLR